MIETIKIFDNEKDARKYCELLGIEFAKYGKKNKFELLGTITRETLQITSIENKDKKQFLMAVIISDSPYDNNKIQTAIFSSSPEELNKFIKYLKTRPIADLYSTTK